MALVDELAHTNAPGVEHEKRYEDIEDMLAAGIDVFSTVNVQHLESLNDQVCELTGVACGRRSPIRCSHGRRGGADRLDAGGADRARCAPGRSTRARELDAALNNFFRIENLAALREVALRQVAEDVEAKRLVVEESVGTRATIASTAAPKAVGERLLALVRPHPSSQRLIRRAWRSSQRLGASLDLLWVRRPGEGPGKSRAAAHRAAAASPRARAWSC